MLGNKNLAVVKHLFAVLTYNLSLLGKIFRIFSISWIVGRRHATSLDP
jgi:hypothetical protein